MSTETLVAALTRSRTLAGDVLVVVDVAAATVRARYSGGTKR
ncbi:MAG TPA: hypothetical protein VFU60_16785 [Ktedonobacterales bacterium]|nr:hypothetical protein [Ktedonobacterales bacterium]